MVTVIVVHARDNTDVGTYSKYVIHITLCSYIILIICTQKVPIRMSNRIVDILEQCWIIW